ncbi:MAG: AbrB/MazE/SpoVT family DNA-binding domain-containing protein [Bifidobacteriaceae bacterium]|nr:AbrB/MazE/SpoVT family DNA-binding domain-containing protein [Bifidobacteriaceae bacterium]
MSVTATMSSKGQLTIPAELRSRHHLTYGQTVTIEEVEGGLLLRAAPRPASRLAGFFGPWRGDPATLEEMDDAIAAGAAQGVA